MGLPQTPHPRPRDRQKPVTRQDLFFRKDPGPLAWPHATVTRHTCPFPFPVQVTFRFNGQAPPEPALAQWAARLKGCEVLTDLPDASYAEGHWLLVAPDGTLSVVWERELAPATSEAG